MARYTIMLTFHFHTTIALGLQTFTLQMTLIMISGMLSRQSLKDSEALVNGRQGVVKRVQNA